MDGVVQVVRRALRRASPAVPVVLHLPRLETWAVHSISAPAARADSQADATSPAAAQEVAEQGLGHAARPPYGCGSIFLTVRIAEWSRAMPQQQALEGLTLSIRWTGCCSSCVVMTPRCHC